jgi:hypothetical protein
MVCYFYVTIFIDSFFRSELNHRKKIIGHDKKISNSFINGISFGIDSFVELM